MSVQLHSSSLLLAKFKDWQVVVSRVFSPFIKALYVVLACHKTYMNVKEILWPLTFCKPTLVCVQSLCGDTGIISYIHVPSSHNIY